MKTVEIFTDGACSGNPGPGGWGAILRYGTAEKELSGGEHETTNNRMELSGVIAGIENGAVTLTNKTTGCVIPLRCDISARQAQIIRAGGLLNYTREKNR